MGCLDYAKTSVLVNGSPTREFDIKRGLRQGSTLLSLTFFGIGVENDEISSFAATSGARVGVFPIKYLGIPIDSNMKLIKNLDPLVEKFRTNLSSWKACLISSGSIHGKSFDTYVASGAAVWSNVVDVFSLPYVNDNVLINAFRLNVGSGTTMRFWHDPWCGTEPLSSTFNRLFHLDINKDDTIADKWGNGVWKWTWSRDIIGWSVLC
ncbi:uncharacterized protein [Rutidosis leptorrhynchoides]|uniref:uncharacterized protein n=1 Tax=Rutidosis leptorrhynchoides TaxID=125765 RepID=UPI003A995E05